MVAMEESVRVESSRRNVDKLEPVVDRVVVPVDGSPFSERALPVAAQLAQEVGAPLHLIEVVAKPRDAEGAIHYLDDLAHRYGAAGLGCHAGRRHRSRDPLRHRRRLAGPSVPGHARPRPQQRARWARWRPPSSTARPGRCYSSGPRPVRRVQATPRSSSPWTARSTTGRWSTSPPGGRGHSAGGSSSRPWPSPCPGRSNRAGSSTACGDPPIPKRTSTAWRWMRRRLPSTASSSTTRSACAAGWSVCSTAPPASWSPARTAATRPLRALVGSHAARIVHDIEVPALVVPLGGR